MQCRCQTKFAIASACTYLSFFVIVFVVIWQFVHLHCYLNLCLQIHQCRCQTKFAIASTCTLASFASQAKFLDCGSISPHIPQDQSFTPWNFRGGWFNPFIMYSNWIMEAKDYIMWQKCTESHSFHSCNPSLLTGNWTSFIEKVRPKQFRDSVYISCLYLKGHKECHGPLMCLNFNTTWLPAEFARASSAAFSYLKRITSQKHSFHHHHHFVWQTSFAYIKYFTLFFEKYALKYFLSVQH